MSAIIDDAKENLGELFISGFNGFELAPETIKFLSEAKIGGTILFSHNYQNPGQIAELTNQIQETSATLPLWICVDQEGGRVQRFKKPFTKIPDAATIGNYDSPKATFEIAEIIGRELKAVGVNVNFCPVADIATNIRNPVIGPRSYGSTEEQVTKMVTAMVRGHLVSGVQPCVKHFPGHGDTSTDSHFALPKIDTPLEVLKEREFKPFIKAFKSRCSMVMTAHIINPKIDPKFPATLSKIVIQDILRKDLRFTKLVISDDMEMKAITDHFGPEDAPRLALDAGCDLLIYRSENATQLAYEALIKALEKGKLLPEVVLLAAQRSQLIKKEVLLPYTPIAIANIRDQIGQPAYAEVMRKIEQQEK